MEIVAVLVGSACDAAMTCVVPLAPATGMICTLAPVVADRVTMPVEARGPSTALSKEPVPVTVAVAVILPFGSAGKVAEVGVTVMPVTFAPCTLMVARPRPVAPPGVAVAVAVTTTGPSGAAAVMVNAPLAASIVATLASTLTLQATATVAPASATTAACMLM